MALKFKTKEEISGEVISTAKEGKDVSIAQTGVFDDDILKKPFEEIIDSGESPRRFVKKVEKWCPLLNAQTVIGHKNISKIKNKLYYEPIFKVLSENKPQKFVLKDLIKLLDAQKFTEGDAQRRVLGCMICMGLIRKVRFTSKNGEKVKDFFYWNTEIKPCPHYKDDACEWDWRNAFETEFYTNQYDEDEEDINIEEEEES